MQEVKDSLRGGAIPCLVKFVSKELSGQKGDPFIYKLDNNTLALCLLGDKGDVESGEKFVAILKGSRRDGGMCSLACEIGCAVSDSKNTYYICDVTSFSVSAKKYYSSLSPNVPPLLKYGRNKVKKKCKNVKKTEAGNS